MNVGRAVAVSAMLCTAAAPAWSQGAPVRVNVGGRMHYQWNSTSVSPDDARMDAPIAASTFETRRVRLSVDVQVSDWIRGLVEPEFAMGRLALRHAWMSFELDSAFVVRAGQFKKPFGLMLLTSSNHHPMIERGVRIRGLDDVLRNASDVPMGDVRGALLVGEQFALLESQGYNAYEMGVSLEGRRGPLSWAAGVFNGSGTDQRDENAGKSTAARVAWAMPSGPPLTVGAAWSRRELNWPLPTSLDRRAGNAFAVDAEYGGFRRGLWILAEAVAGDNLASEERFAAAQAVAAWFLPTGGARVEGWEPVARVSWGDPDRTVDGDAGLLLTPGVNVYFAGRNRFMLNWDVFVPQGDGSGAQHAARAQVNLSF
jgi:hypothetical protein